MIDRPTDPDDSQLNGSGQDALVDYTNSRHRLRRITTKFALRARRRMYDSFIEVMAPASTTTIVDIGVTPDRSTEDSNFLEKWYPYPAHITATSIEDASYLESAHPGLHFVQTSGDRLPFADAQFDIAFSSAVIEHVGDRMRQRHFLAELLRVSKRFFITTPDRRFPVELHTFLPLVHWLPQQQHQRVLRSLGMTTWAQTENLNLLDERAFRHLFPAAVRPTFIGPRLLGMRSNLIAFGSSHGVDEPRRMARNASGAATVLHDRSER
jgi:SAM-dependent methyltransferase